jgi:hypothetical protein
MIMHYDAPRVVGLGTVASQTLGSVAICKTAGSGDTNFASEQTKDVTSTQTGTNICSS